MIVEKARRLENCQDEIRRKNIKNTLARLVGAYEGICMMSIWNLLKYFLKYLMAGQGKTGLKTLPSRRKRGAGKGKGKKRQKNV